LVSFQVVVRLTCRLKATVRRLFRHRTRTLAGPQGRLRLGGGSLSEDERERLREVLTNFYSTPLQVGAEVKVKVQAAYVEIWHEGKCVA
jgi:hypothetical protein